MNNIPGNVFSMVGVDTIIHNSKKISRGLDSLVETTEFIMKNTLFAVSLLSLKLVVNEFLPEDKCILTGMGKTLGILDLESNYIYFFGESGKSFSELVKDVTYGIHGISE